ncbi:MAG: hypothetical protein QY318_02035 [Candidatus Dojkabacteria bacterium]|nr:MAG: hypothetical protein QY318_02035 [Candidatus Dojkabacteria bacterium]
MTTNKVQSITDEQISPENDPCNTTAQPEVDPIDSLIYRLIDEAPHYHGLDPFTENYQYGSDNPFTRSERAKAIHYRVKEWLDYLEEEKLYITSEDQSSAGSFTLVSKLKEFEGDKEFEAILLNTLVRLSAQEIDTLSCADIWRSDLSAVHEAIKRSRILFDQRKGNRTLTKHALRVGTAICLALILASCASGDSQPEFDHIVCRVGDSLEDFYPVQGSDGTVSYTSSGIEDPWITLSFGSGTTHPLYLTPAGNGTPPLPQGTNIEGVVAHRGSTSTDPLGRILGYLEYLFDPKKVVFEATVSPDDPSKKCVGVMIPPTLP